MRVLPLLDRVGSVGALLAAIAASCCFPLFAAMGTALGLGALGRFEGIILYFFQGFALLSLLGLVIAYRQHRQLAPLLLGAASVAALAYAFYYSYSLVALYTGLFGLLAATLWNRLSARTTPALSPVLQSVLTCPHCAHEQEETMPTDACLFFYECPGCGTRLKPKPGDCCVFCSYGTVPCPPIQMEASCCG